jgi:multidrug efflux pump subunit AcrB
MNSKTVSSFRSSLVCLLALLFVILGAGAAVKMDVQAFPNQNVPLYTIRVSVPGMIPERVDETVTRPVEEAVRELGGVEKLASTSRTGSAQVSVTVKESIGSDYKDRLSEKLAELSKRLPTGAVQVEQENLKDNEIGHLFLHGTDLQTLSDVARYTVYEKLINIPGVSRVEMDTEGVQNKVEVLFRPSMLQAYALTPGDVIRQLQGDSSVEQLGTVGEGKEQTGFQWISQASSPQELGKQLIASDKGYVALKVLADIRDLRGSKGEAVPVYRGEPAVGVRVFAQEAGQIPSVRADVMQAIEELNEAAQTRYVIDLFADRQAVLSFSLRDMGVLVGLAAVVSSVLMGVWWRSAAVAVIALLSVVLATGALLGGLWLSGTSLNLASLGPITLFALLFIGAGTALFNRMVRVEEYSLTAFDREAKQLIKPLLLSVVVFSILYGGVLCTDFLKGSDKPTLYEALPVIGWGTLALLLVYGFIAPTLAAMWLTEPLRHRQPSPRGKMIAYLVKRWERLTEQGYLPYGMILTISVLTVALLSSFVIADPYNKTNSNEMTISLKMLQDRTVDDAVQAAKAAEEKLRKVAEVADLYTVATKQELIFQLILKDKYDWTRSRADLEKELDKQLQDIPGTDPFALVVGEDRGSRMEFTIKGPSLNTTRDIANQMVTFLTSLRWRDDDGREIITDEKSSATDDRTYITIKPKPGMLARYQVSEADVKSQLQSYLGEQQAGSAFWSDRTVPIVVRYPEPLMEHPDQVKNILIRTPKGTVRLVDLVDWRIGTAPATYQKEDGLYVFKVSSAVSQPGRISSLYYYLPLTMQKSMTIPDGYTILNADQVRKLEKEESDETDVGTRVVVAAVVLVTVMLASVLLLRRVRDGATVLLVLPTLAGAVLLGLLALDRPLNVLGFYGIAAAAALIIQQTLVHLDSLVRAQKTSPSIQEGVRRGTGACIHSVSILFAALVAASLPLAAGAADGIDFHASFAAALLAGALLGWYVVTVLVPAMYQAAERKKVYQSEFSLPLIRQRIVSWWENERVRRKDLREWKKREKQKRQELQGNNAAAATPRHGDLSDDDFLPLGRFSSANDANN